MKHKIILVLGLTFFLNTVNAQTYTGPIARPTTGYGSDGTHTVAIESFVNPYYPTENIQIYHPSNITTPVPTIFYSHPYGGYNPAGSIGLLNFFAKRGYAIVFVPYQTTGVTVPNRYENLLNGFRTAAQNYPSIIDTSKVGFLGYSFGGGASIGIAYKCFTEDNWGSAGKFVFAMAPWYSYNITQTELQSFPTDTKLLTVVLEDDAINDHRMGADIFLNINIPNSEKDFLKVPTSTVSGYTYSTGHNMPSTQAAFDAMDYYAYYRLLDAMCDYVFNGNLAGKDVALGNGSTNQINMPTGMLNLVETDTPTAVYPESNYSFPCSNATGNPRVSYCGLVLSTENNLTLESKISIFPNPVDNIINISSAEKTDIEIFTLQGQSVLFEKNAEKINIQNFSAGIYLIKLYNNEKSYQYKIVKN